MKKVVAANQSVHQVCLLNQTLLNSEIIFHSQIKLVETQEWRNNTKDSQILQSLMSAQISQQRSWPCHLKGFVKMISTTFNNPWLIQLPLTLYSGLSMAYPGLSYSRVKGSRNETYREVIQVPKRIWIETYTWVVGYCCHCLDEPDHTCLLIGKLSCAIRKLKTRSVCMQSAFLLFCCFDEKSMHANLSPS